MDGVLGAKVAELNWDCATLFPSLSMDHRVRPAVIGVSGMLNKFCRLLMVMVDEEMGSDRGNVS